jgi:hypothetical protein
VTTEETGLPADVSESIEYAAAARAIVDDPRLSRRDRLLAIAVLGEEAREQAASPVLSQAALWREVAPFVLREPEPRRCSECGQVYGAERRGAVLALAGARDARGRR